MLQFVRRAFARPAVDLDPHPPIPDRVEAANAFLAFNPLPPVESPTGRFWFQSMPLPDGTRVRGANADVHREPRLWESCFGDNRHVLAGKRVLDVGANDGYFTLAALLCGAESAHAVNTDQLSHGSFPANLRHAAAEWGLEPRITVGDFFDLPTDGPKYDVIFFFGMLYAVENVFAAVRLLARLLAPGGVVYLETQTTRAESDLPVMEVASDEGGTVPQFRGAVGTLGNSTLLVPNPAAVRAVAQTYGLRVQPLPSPNRYEDVHGGPGRRRVFKLTRESEAAVPMKG